MPWFCSNCGYVYNLNAEREMDLSKFILRVWETRIKKEEEQIKSEDMNHCSIENWTTWYHTSQDRPSEAKLSSFHHPFSKLVLLQKWIKFTNRKEWTPPARLELSEGEGYA